MIHPARLHLNRGVRHRILQGHPWVFASEVDRIEGAVEDGETVEIRSTKDELLGSAIYNSRSQIVARRYAFGSVPLDAALLGARLEAALRFRGPFSPGAARRLVWSESDGLPGLIVDRYDDVLVLQTLTCALSRREEIIAGLLAEKTGFYLDQAENYAAVAAYAPGRRVLDCFTNQGAFALAARRAGATSCRAIDQSGEALRLAAATGRREKLEVEWIEGNVFDLLREYEQRREPFDLVVLDPPSFTKSKGNKEAALRGYHELHLRALRLLTPGGILATFSCSHHVTAEDWRGLLQRAATETGFTLRLRRELSQARDHPILVNVPETEYLHGYVVEKLDDRETF